MKIIIGVCVIVIDLIFVIWAFTRKGDSIGGFLNDFLDIMGIAIPILLFGLILITYK